MKWRPMKTVPKDGTFVILTYFDRKGFPLHVEICHYFKSSVSSIEHWTDLRGFKFCCGGQQPDGWIPLPTQPKGGESKMACSTKKKGGKKKPKPMPK